MLLMDSNKLSYALWTHFPTSKFETTNMAMKTITMGHTTINKKMLPPFTLSVIFVRDTRS